MGGIRCKVIIDYGNWSAEATALATLAASSKHSDKQITLRLAAEAYANAKAAYGGWVAALEAVEYNAASEPSVRAQSKKACEWAKALRTWCDALDDGNSPNPYENWIRTMRQWRDDDLAFYQAFDTEASR